ncbi:hypothetical protein ACIA5D_02990 [Actinoplanes sp. NPDC051513]|uniref:hypothetical protein n=1 Tax=Actinoplanes sp. NPDC051513 TaxID=3363908 RepID=UPI0037BD8400
MTWHLFDPDTFEIGRTTVPLEEQTYIGLYDAPRSIIDAARLRHREGSELVYGALRRWLSRRGSSPSELLAMARRFPQSERTLREAMEISVNDRPTRATVAGRAYLDLQNLVRRTKRPTNELHQPYAVEGFLAWLVESAYADRLILKGGVTSPSVSPPAPFSLSFSAPSRPSWAWARFGLVSVGCGVIWTSHAKGHDRAR